MRWVALGLRGRLALSIAAIVIGAFAVTFFAVYRGTGSALRSRIDRELRTEVDGLTHTVKRPSEEGNALAAARAYISSQPFGPSARLLIVSLSGGPTVTNQPELIGAVREPRETSAEHRRELRQATALHSTPAGFTTLDLTDTGQVRILTRVVMVGRRKLVVRAGEPLAPVNSAQSDVSRTFLIVGSLTLAAALLAGYVLATRTAAPLRRIARVAAAVDAGDLTPRIGSETAASEEVRTLAESFDHMLDRLDDAFSRQRQFVSDASHELRTPLTAIRGQLEVLAQQADPHPEEVRRVEKVVLAETSRIERLVGDLLTLARLDEGVELQVQDLELEEYVRQLLSDQVMKGEVEVGQLPSGRLRADSDRIAQVVRNLVRNAQQHAGPQGSVRISGHSEDGRVVIDVDDDGPGIPASERDRVFDRLHRLDTSRARGSGGSGLGLAIARSIVELHSGRIWVGESPLGGARVSISLPGFSSSQRSSDAEHSTGKPRQERS